MEKIFTNLKNTHFLLHSFIFLLQYNIYFSTSTFSTLKLSVKITKMFSANILFYWTVFTCLTIDCMINAHIINTNEMLDHRKLLKVDLVTACQMSCLDKFLFNEDEAVNPFWNIIDQCIDRPKCYMCYDFCEMLNDESRMIGKLMCTHETCVRIANLFIL